MKLRAAEPLRLRVDPSGDLAKLLGERVAVNARQAAILVQVIANQCRVTGRSTASAVRPSFRCVIFSRGTIRHFLRAPSSIPCLRHII